MVTPTTITITTTGAVYRAPRPVVSSERAKSRGFTQAKTGKVRG